MGSAAVSIAAIHRAVLTDLSRGAVEIWSIERNHCPYESSSTVWMPKTCLSDQAIKSSECEAYPLELVQSRFGVRIRGVHGSLHEADSRLEAKGRKFYPISMGVQLTQRVEEQK